MNQTFEGFGMGWLPDYPDFRDFTPRKGDAPAGEERNVPDLLQQVGVQETKDPAKHSVVVAGFDDQKQIRHANPGSEATAGALLIRNSWGTAWGDHGYGWLPYAYVLSGLAVDWWSLITSEWVDTGVFQLD